MKALVLKVAHEGNSINQVQKTMTVGELIDFLQDYYAKDIPIVIQSDGFGGIRMEHFDDSRLYHEADYLDEK